MTENECERYVLDTVLSEQGDVAPYTLCLELKRMLAQIVDADTDIDTSAGVLWPFGAPNPIVGHSEADLYATVGGIEFMISLRRSNPQLLKDGVSAEQLGVPPLDEV